LFYSEGGHLELRVDLIPRIPPPVYQGLGLFGAVHRTEHYFFSLAGDMPELSLNCSENGTRLLERVMNTPLLPDALWNLIEPLLPLIPHRPKGGRPRLPDLACLTGMLFVLPQWRSLGVAAARNPWPALSFVGAFFKSGEGAVG